MANNPMTPERCLTCAGPAASLLFHAPGAICQVISLVQKVSRSNANVLISGETGVGKDVVARAIYAERRDRLPGIPFEAVNVTAIPFELMESTLFGHRKGAFTGATQDQLGHFSTAGKGVLFLDEVGDLPLAQQPKLLRAVENREFTRVGDTTKLLFNGQIVSATNQSLEDMIRLKTFREDLYYRLRQVHIFIPPLRTRPHDVDVLINYFINREKLFVKNEYGQERHVGFSINNDAKEWLMAYKWPGNIRQLASLISEMRILYGNDANISQSELEGSALVVPVPSAHEEVANVDNTNQPLLIRDRTDVAANDVFGVAAAIVDHLVDIHADGSIRHSLRRAVSHCADTMPIDKMDISVLRREISRLIRHNWTKGRLHIFVTGARSPERQRVSAQITNTVKAVLSEHINRSQTISLSAMTKNTNKMPPIEEDINDRIDHTFADASGYGGEDRGPIGVYSSIESMRESIEARFATRAIVEGSIENDEWRDKLRKAILGFEPTAQTARTIGLMMELVVREVTDPATASFADTCLVDKGAAIGILQHLAESHRAVVSIAASKVLEQLLDSIRRNMVYIPSNTFRMGSDRNAGESPIHNVELDGFWIDRWPVTIGEFSQFLKESGGDHFAWNAAGSDQDDYPVVFVSWYEATNFARWVGKELPTEAQWECAARGGLDQKLFPWGDEDPDASKACYSTVAPTKVGKYPPNRFGLYDMAGLVEEWVLDWYGPDYYSHSAVHNPAGIPFGTHKVTRGGAYIREAHEIRCAQRYYFAPDNFGPVTGFRCAQSEHFKINVEKFFEQTMPR